MKKPSRKVIAGIAAFASAIAAGTTTVAVKRQKAKAAPKKEESNDVANLFV